MYTYRVMQSSLSTELERRVFPLQSLYTECTHESVFIKHFQWFCSLFREEPSLFWVPRQEREREREVEVEKEGTERGQTTMPSSQVAQKEVQRFTFDKSTCIHSLENCPLWPMSQVGRDTRGTLTETMVEILRKLPYSPLLSKKQFIFTHKHNHKTVAVGTPKCPRVAFPPDAFPTTPSRCRKRIFKQELEIV